jgi:hypothetical protein
VVGKNVALAACCQIYIIYTNLFTNKLKSQQLFEQRWPVTNKTLQKQQHGAKAPVAGLIV